MQPQRVALAVFVFSFQFAGAPAPTSRTIPLNLATTLAPDTTEDMTVQLWDSPVDGALLFSEAQPALTVDKSGNVSLLFGGLHLAALMREHGIQEIRTADTDFHVFPFLRVVNPLHA